jgi:nicotinamidase-related amidase
MVAPHDVLLIVDIQNDFCPGGRLAVPRADEIVAPINRIARQFGHVVLTQDWHPADHISFASRHPGRRPFDTIELPYGSQTLWPDHCVQGTPGAAFHEGFAVPHAELIVRKGFHRDIDSYSTFFENDHATPTGLAGYLRERGLTHVFLAGLATDFCVAWSAVDGRRLGFEVTVLLGACRAIDTQGSLAGAMTDMRNAGVTIVESAT